MYRYFLAYKCYVEGCAATYNSYQPWLIHLIVVHDADSPNTFFRRGDTAKARNHHALSRIVVDGLDKCPECNLVLPTQYQMLLHIRNVHPSVGKGRAPRDELTAHLRCLDCQQCVTFAGLQPHLNTCLSVVYPDLRPRKCFRSRSTYCAT